MGWFAVVAPLPRRLIRWIQLEPTDQPAAFTLSILADQGAVSA